MSDPFQVNRRRAKQVQLHAFESRMASINDLWMMEARVAKQGSS